MCHLETFGRLILALVAPPSFLALAWYRREIAPLHFPGADGSYEAFLQEGFRHSACCTGIPPEQLERNLVGHFFCVGLFVYVLVVTDYTEFTIINSLDYMLESWFRALRPTK